MTVWKSCPRAGRGPAAPILFLDRDGVVVVDRDYLDDPDLVELVPGSAAAMAAAAADGFLLVGMSNQSGLGRGYFTVEDLARVMTRLDELLAAAGAPFDGFYYCPHEPGAGCRCRKPGPGLLEELARVRTWPARDSWMVGDKASDVAFGRDHGLGAVLVRTGYGAEQEKAVRRRWADDPRVLVADDLWEAYALIRECGRPGVSS